LNDTREHGDNSRVYCLTVYSVATREFPWTQH